MMIKELKMSFQIKEPILIIGLGGAGTRLAVGAKDRLDADMLAISNDQSDLHGYDAIKISTAPVINPSVQLIRGSSYREYDSIKEKISGYSTIIIMANLAGRAGSALAPVISQICKDAGKDSISFVIMPFRYEKNRIFNSGVALKHLKENSGCTILMDNDALLESNPSLSPNACFDIANNAILYMVSALSTAEIGFKTGVLTTSATNPDVEESLRDSLKMLYGEVPLDSIKHSMLYVAGRNIPVGILDSISNITSKVLGGEGVHVNMESISDESNVVMLSGIHGMTKFDNYDPLGTIPQENTLDWDEPEVSIECNLDLYQME